MKRSALLVLSLACLSGCASQQPKRVQYEDFTLIIADPTGVDRACMDNGGKWDNGQRVGFKERYAGCWKPDQREIWIRWDDIGARALPHELCHKDGHADCESYNWPN